MFDRYSEALRAGQRAGLDAAYAQSLCVHRFTITDPDCLMCSGVPRGGCDNYEEEPDD